jgi:hypothetical protein
MKLEFQIHVRPSSFDILDELENLTEEDSVRESLEEAISDVLQSYLRRGGFEIAAELL